MELWIFIGFAVLGILTISIIAFIIKCYGYKKVIKKIRTLSTSSSNHDGAGAGSSARASTNRQTIVPPPPAYTISLQHRVLMRSTATDPRSDHPDNPNPDDLGNVTIDQLSSEDQSDSNVQLCPGYAFPGDGLFIPPPYCLEPPAYTEHASEDDMMSGVDDQAPSYSPV